VWSQNASSSRAASQARRRREIERLEAGAELGLEPLGELVGEVHRALVPAALVVGGREDRCEGGPQPETAIADRDERAGQAALTQAAHDGRPGLGALAIAEFEPEQLLGPVRPGADHDEQARVLRFLDRHRGRPHPPRCRQSDR
jgi:hypothetical protein